MILLPWLLSRTAYLKRHALIDRARGTRARVFSTVARKAKVKNLQESFMAWTAKQSGTFLKICPAKNNSALNFASRGFNEVMLNGSVFKCSYFRFHKLTTQGGD